MPAARLCSIAATILSRWKTCRRVRCEPAFGATLPSRCTSNAPSSCEAKSSSSSLRARWVARSMALRVSLSIRGRLLHDDFLARPDEARAFLTHAFERGVELLFGLDAAAEVAPNTHAHDPLTVDDVAQL